MYPTVILDSCVIYPMPLCDTLMRIAEADLYRIHFSQEILDGATRNLVKNGRMAPDKAKRFESFLISSFPEALVNPPPALEEIMTNHPGDRHVLAAAIACKAEVILTFNLRHFQEKDLNPWSIEALHPDQFLLDMVAHHGIEALSKIIQEQADILKRPPMTVLELLEKLYLQVPNFVHYLVTNLYGSHIDSIARRLLALPLAERSASNQRLLQGKYYILHLIDDKLSITSTSSHDNKQCLELLKSEAGTIKGSLTPLDVNRFYEIEKILKECR